MNVPSKKRLMIDLETTGLTSLAGVWQIGYTEMIDAANFRGLIHLNPYDQDREVDENTVSWLEENADDWIKMRPMFPYLPLSQSTLRGWSNFIAKQDFDEVWCKGADFDFAILRSLLNDVDVPLPWHYRKQCCMRGFLNTYPEFEVEYDSIQSHNGEYDAIVQSECMNKILKHLGRW